MIIACSKEGQLCNRLFHLSHFIANAWGNKLKLRYLYFDEYLKFFNENLCSELNKNGVFIETHPIIKMGYYLVARLSPQGLQKTSFYQIIRTKENVNLNDPPIIKAARSTRLLMFGWGFRDPYHFREYQKQIRSLFDFTTAVKMSVNKKIERLKKGVPNLVLIGVHIRRGDYEHFLNGKYFFSDEVYLEKMSQLSSLFSKAGKKTLFLIASNDNNLEKNSLFINDAILINRGNEIEDLYALSQCDYLIGPPSTFTSWASFYGEVPLQFIESKNHLITHELFEINCG